MEGGGGGGGGGIVTGKKFLHFKIFLLIFPPVLVRWK